MLVELHAAVQTLTRRREDHGVAVEDELILATDHVEIHDRHARTPCLGREQRGPLDPLAVVVRRAVDVEQDGRSGVGLPAGRSGVGPDVLTDRDPDGDSGDVPHRLGMLAGNEVASLVEHAVVGQQDFAVHTLDRPVREDGSGVGEGTGDGVVAVRLGFRAIDEADHCRGRGGRSGEGVEGLDVA